MICAQDAPRVLSIRTELATQSKSCPQLVPIAALGCCATSLYCPGSGCIGGELQGDVLCLRTQTILCRPSQEDAADTCCLCFRGYGMCVYPSSLCAFRSTLFCLDQRCALPANDETPCMCTVCGATCYYGSGPNPGAQFHCEFGLEESASRGRSAKLGCAAASVYACMQRLCKRHPRQLTSNHQLDETPRPLISFRLIFQSEKYLGCAKLEVRPIALVRQARATQTN